MQVLPDDPHDRTLVAHVHPPDWVNPVPDGRYDLVVVGGGPAGLVAALGAAGLGAKVALIERGLLGGDCLVTGCVPSKAVLRSAHAALQARRAGPLGVTAEVRTDFGAVMERMRAIRAGIAPHDGAERLRSAGIDVYLGEARFSGPDAVDVAGTSVGFVKALIATGARAVLPPIPGLAEAGALTHETLFTLTERPERLGILGAGVIGCEMAQAFAGLGCEVHVFELADRVLPAEDPDASARIGAALARDGVQLHLSTRVTGVERSGEVRTLVLDDGRRVAVDVLLVAVGRRPSVDLGLDAAGVEHSASGVVVDDHLRTTNRRIFAAGDVTGRIQLTHAADHQARVALRNALFFGRARVSALVVPRVTFTDPEVASVGIGPEEAASDPSITTWTVALDETDRGRTDGDEGFCRVHADRRGRIRGATVVGPHAGELLAPVTLAMTHGLTLAKIADTVHAYPTRSEALFKIASQYRRSQLRPWMPRLVSTVLGLFR